MGLAVLLVPLRETGGVAVAWYDILHGRGATGVEVEKGSQIMVAMVLMVLLVSGPL